MSLRIGIDLMGGDNPPVVLWRSLLSLISIDLKSFGGSFVLFADTETISFLKSDFEKHCYSFPCPLFIESENYILMEDTPLASLRKKKSSMALGLDFLNEHQIDVFISTGNTGALVALAKTKISMCQGVDKSVLLGRVPTEDGSAVVLDIGANINVKPDELLQFARMGQLYSSVVIGKDNPSIGLLNIGTEEHKGTEDRKIVYQLLKNTFPNCFIGNVEGNEVFSGKADVVVTDGFTGNIFLKTAEGVFAFLQKKLGSVVKTHFEDGLDHVMYPSSLLCGLTRLVVKCHGNISPHSFKQGVLGAIYLAELDICNQISNSFI